jgi:hypothetical protein
VGLAENFEGRARCDDAGGGGLGESHTPEESQEGGETMSMKEYPVPRSVAPELTLMILAPMIAEVLSGSTRLSYM